MLDRISGFFRRSGDGKPAGTAPATSPAKPAPALPSATDAAAAARQARADDAARLLDGSPSATDLLGIARDDLPAELRLRAIARLDDAAALRGIALEDRVARVRLAAAERLTAPEDLEALRRDSSDKAVQRHARDALKTLRDADKAAQETRARIRHLLASIEQHASRAFEPLYDAKLDSLEAAWQPLAAQADAQEQERFAELAALARDTVNRHAAEIGARQQAIAAKQELIAACNELETVVARLAHEDLTGSLAAVSALHATQDTRWQEAAGLTAVDAPLEKRFRAASATLDAWLGAAAELPRVAQEASALLAAIAEAAAGEEPDSDTLDDWHHALDALVARCAWPEGLLAPPLLAELADARRQVRQWEKARQLDRQQQIAQLRRRRHALKRMIDEGQLRAATRTMAWLKKRVADLPAADAATENAALDALAEPLQRLHDWYEFASVPKKTELCERVEALAAEAVGTDAESIAARTAQVRELRDQWNLLCAADPDADPALRDRFNAAAGRAYAPCAAFYAELHRQQDENLAKRAALCDELAAWLDALEGTTPAWKAVEQRERDTRAAWKTLEPVRWPDARATQDRFSALIGRLRARLDGERQANAAKRDALIAQAVALQTQEPLESAIAAAKRLQDAWKGVGYTDPRDDRRQWQPFRSALDAVFARRDAARDAEREAREAAQAEAARQQLEQTRRQAEEQQRRDARAAQQREARQAEIDTALALGEAEGRWLAGESVDADSLAARIDALGKSPLLASLQARLDALRHDRSPADDALAANAATLATLTLDIEITFELPSPPDVAGARMQRKVERLNAALRGRERDAGDPKVALVNAWLAVGPVTSATRLDALARVGRVIKG